MAKQKLYIDGLGLVEGHFSGVGQYILGIIRGMDRILERQKLAGEDTPTIKVLIPYDTVEQFKSYGFKHIKYKRLPIKFRVLAGLWHRNKVPPLELFCGRGYFLFPRFVSMRLLFSTSGVVIYDLSYELYPEFADTKNAKFLSDGAKRTINSTRDVFTISKNSQKEIAEFYKIDDTSKISIAYPAADPNIFYKRSESEVAKIKQKYGVKKDYILALSNLEPRKNLETLVDAYCKLPASIRKKYSLLLVGVSGWKTDRLFTKITELVEEGFDIIRPSEYVTDLDKPAVISGASLLVYPSIYEGFGMPPLEALSCGVPVIAADNSSLPEVVGAAGTMLNCYDVEGFTKAIEHTIKNIDSISNSQKTAGPKQAEAFNWEASAQVYLDKVFGR